MKIKRQWFVKTFILLFSVSVSVAVLPCGIINVHGLFGEVTSTTITEDARTEHTYKESRTVENRKQVKGIRIYNIWLKVWIGILCMVFVKYRFRLPREDTIVTFKVRMDN